MGQLPMPLDEILDAAIQLIDARLGGRIGSPQFQAALGALEAMLPTHRTDNGNYPLTTSEETRSYPDESGR